MGNLSNAAEYKKQPEEKNGETSRFLVCGKLLRFNVSVRNMLPTLYAAICISVCRAF